MCEDYLASEADLRFLFESRMYLFQRHLHIRIYVFVLLNKPSYYLSSLRNIDYSAADGMIHTNRLKGRRFGVGWCAAVEETVFTE